MPRPTPPIWLALILFCLPVAAPAQGWGGPYAGLSAGYVMGRADADTGLGRDDTIDSYGWDYGPFAGYRHPFANGTLLGAEVGYLWSNADGREDFGSNANVSGAWGSFDKRGEAYLSLHAGAEVRPGLLLYGIAGLQSGRFHYDAGTADFGQAIDQNATTDGWHLGVGAAMAARGPISGRIEYKYQSYDSFVLDDLVDPRESVIRFGVEFSLNNLAARP